MRLLKNLGMDQTKGQIFVGFILMMVLVLSLMMGSLYYLLSKVQKENAARYMDEIAVQVSGRLESLLNEINVLTLQLAMDERIQAVLGEELQGDKAAYEEIMKLRKLLLDKTAYSETIGEIELFSAQGSIYPIVDKHITERIGARYVHAADEPHQAGAIVWIGRDPEDPEYLLAVRQVRLEKLGYTAGGYLVIRIRPSLINFISRDVAKAEGSVMSLLDADRNKVSTDTDEGTLLAAGNAELRGERYVTIEETIESANWLLQISVPKKTLMKDIYFLRDVLLWSAILSGIMFAVLSYYLSLLITSPIKRLTRVMQKGKIGNPKENPDIYFNREVNQLNVKYNQMVREINHLIKSVYEKELMKSKSEIKALHSQIHPHFLFNTLDSLYWAHICKGEQELAGIVSRLADLFRYSIQSSGDDGFVWVEEELEQVRRYADIMKMRWHDRVQVIIEDYPGAASLRIPKLTIQPLVENAMIHGIEPLESGGKITLRICEADGVISFIIEDNGVGMSADRLQEIRGRLADKLNIEFISGGNGIGMFNVCKLIQLHYGEQYGLSIDSVPDEGTTVVLRIPQGAGKELEHGGKGDIGG